MSKIKEAILVVFFLKKKDGFMDNPSQVAAWL